MLVHFNRSENETKADLFEKTGNILLAPLRLSCGKTVKIGKDLHNFDVEKIHTITRIVLAIFSFVFLPFTALMALTGYLFTRHSSTYSEAYGLYKKQIEKTGNIPLTPELSTRRTSTYVRKINVKQTANTTSDKIKLDSAFSSIQVMEKISNNLWYYLTNLFRLSNNSLENLL